MSVFEKKMITKILIQHWTFVKQKKISLLLFKLSKLFEFAIVKNDVSVDSFFSSRQLSVIHNKNERTLFAQ